MSYKDYHIILASNSPRRRELLRGLDIAFDVRVQPDIAETYPETTAPADVAGYISREKADAYKDTIAENELVITADTVVIVENEILKPPRRCRSKANAAQNKRTEAPSGYCRVPYDDGKAALFLGFYRCNLQKSEGRRDRLLHRNLSSIRQGRRIRHSRVDWLHRCNGTRGQLFQRNGTARTAHLGRTERLLVYKNNGFNGTKQGFLQSKTMGFTTQNNGFCKIKQWVL